MPAIAVNPPFPLFTDADGQPLDDAYIYIGTANQNPVSNPITVYWDEALTIPAAQPIRTNAGYAVRNGSPSRFYAGANYSILVRDKNGSFVYTAADENLFSSVDATFIQSGTGAVTRSVQDKLRESVSVKDFGAVGDGVTDDWPAFQAAHDSLSASNSNVGGEIYVPSGTYYLSQTWAITKRVTIRGTNAGDQPQTSACILKFPADTNGIRFYSDVDSATGTDATQSRLIGVELKANAKNVSGVGIKATTTVRIEHCIVRDFKSHGIEFHGQTGSGATGIADFWAVKQTRIVTCGGHGLYHHGNDSQVGIAEQVESVSNGGWGFYNDSPYTSTYIACQAAGNTSGAYFYSGTMTYQGGIYLGCYAEAGTGANCSLTAGCLVLGGTISYASGMALVNDAPGGCGINVPTGGRWMGWRNGTEVWRIDESNVMSGLSKYFIGTLGTYLAASIGHIYQSGTSSQDAWRFDNGNGRVGSISTSGTSTAYNTSSDYRLKENIQPITDAINKISSLKPCTWSWKKDGAKGQGFIAHELQAVIPGCVTGQKDAVDKDGKPIYQGVDVSFLVPTLVKACQEMLQKINVLETKLAGIGK